MSCDRCNGSGRVVVPPELGGPPEAECFKCLGGSAVAVDPNAKLIFLDIDGVLNDHRYNEASMSGAILPECVARLNRILEATDARIVLSSAWRYMLIGRAMSVTGFDYLLRTHGVIANRLVGRTCADEEVKERGWQIHEWRKANDHRGRYVVIDDMDLHISPLHPFVRTDGGCGLADADADAAIRHLAEVPR